MPTPTFNPDIGPSWPYRDARTPRVLMSEYGDGYIERAGDGINTQYRNLSLTWENIYTEEMPSIFGFLEARKGYEKFFWVPVSEEEERRFICPEFDKEAVDVGVWNVTATFKEVFDP